ncbi:TerD family protein [Streptomyces sp. NPDC059786]|uniref:TerD family protein n=1 Tax=Streptomyces sp. NPDC059786 TaxID=3346946 RepID=UPI00364BF083
MYVSDLVKGANSFVPTVSLRIAVRGELRATALLLAGDGRVRGDQDVVTDGAPSHPSGGVRLAGGADGTTWLEAGLGEVEADVERVLVVGSTRGGTVRETGVPSVEAYAPDGTSVARYEMTEVGDETALVLAELYRRAGGWKFRAVGQGYTGGLQALAADHGVGVMPVAGAAPVGVAFASPTGAPAAAPIPTPVPGAQVPAPAQVPTPVPAPAQLPTPVPAQAPAQVPTVAVPSPAAAAAPLPQQPQPVPRDWVFGPVFEPRTLTGRDNDVLQMDGLPPGPVVVELLVRGEGWTCLTPLNRRNKEGDVLVNSTEDDFQGRLLTTVPQDGPLRLRLQAEGPWQVTVLPLAAAHRLTGEWLEWRGPDVLLHTAGPSDFAIRYKGDDNLIAHRYELEGHTDHATLPRRENFINEIGARRETHPLPEGPVIVELEMADGPWRARLKGVGQPEDTAPEDSATVQAFAPFTAPDPERTNTVRKSRWGWRGRG